MTDDSLLKMMEASKILQPSGAGCEGHGGARPVSLTESNSELPTNVYTNYTNDIRDIDTSV